MRELLQRSGLLRRRFSLDADGIRVTEASLVSGRSVVIPYEVVYGEKFERWSASVRALIGTIVLAALSITTLFISDAERFAWLFWMIGAIVCGAYYGATRREEVGYYDAGARIVFFRDRPTAAAFEAFLDEIERRARDRVRSRILPLRHSEDARADRQRAALLRDKQIISEEEHAEFVRDLGMGAPSPRPAHVQN